MITLDERAMLERLEPDALFEVLFGTQTLDDLELFLAVFAVLVSKSTLAAIVREFDARETALRALEAVAENAQNGGTR